VLEILLLKFVININLRNIVIYFNTMMIQAHIKLTINTLIFEYHENILFIYNNNIIKRFLFLTLFDFYYSILLLILFFPFQNIY